MKEDFEMVRYEITIGYYEGAEAEWKEYTERGIAVRPTPDEAISQIKEFYGDDLIGVKIIYDEMMSDKCYSEWCGGPWFTKEG